MVTTAGGIEEDFIKCLGPTYLGAFDLPGRELRSKGINRIGNLLVPNNNYCLFEDWLTPLLDRMLQEQRQQVRGQRVRGHRVRGQRVRGHRVRGQRGPTTTTACSRTG